MAKTTATVRMYKGLLGDCFLIRLKSGQSVSHILIDCGILQNIPGDKAKMQAVAADIVAETGGRLDLLVVTHEHHDHISGFAHAKAVFLEGGLKIDNLWMAWTEKEGDPQADALNLKFNKAKQAVAMAVDRASALAAAGVPGADDIVGGLEAFIGPVDPPGGVLGAAERLTGKVVMRKLKEVTRGGGGKVEFLEPGDVKVTPGAANLKAYVLGPPRTEKRLYHDLPSHHPGKEKETYLDRFSAANQLLSAAEGAWEDGEPERPFAPRHGLTPERVQAGSRPGHEREEIEQDVDWLKTTYYAAPNWRRVDAEWLGMAGALALKLDSDTNNTSLVLAFEAPGGEVLLFAADAQVGNWLSWHDQTYGPAATAAADLLSRTVFYKVGHHCSHNATLRKDGLELMTSPDLVAMIPVVESIAREQGTKGWNMPFPPLLERLLEKTKGRVLRGDQPTDESVFKKKRVRTGPADLWVEYDALV
ncbi:MBL fold metallo-hydrolase [Phenylobacterium sp.]|uniref:MBL fold metallo-hydrolase n=1 Tax=Phenylobacterium sp. TaxID=1871053 RepID=UPI002FC7BDCE